MSRTPDMIPFRTGSDRGVAPGQAPVRRLEAAFFGPLRRRPFDEPPHRSAF